MAAPKKATKKPAPKKKAVKVVPLNTEVTTEKGAVSLKPKAGPKAEKKTGSFSVIMRGGKPAKVEDNGDE